MKRRDLLRAGLAAGLLPAWGSGALAAAVRAGAGRPARLDPAAWRAYIRRFVLPEGRVADTGNKGISHSEGQGYGMLLAVAADDRATFDSLWGWTRTTLMVRGDGLTAWRWVPGEGVSDRNNASDGDILIAWALLTAAEAWRVEEYRTAAVTLVQALAAAVVVEQAGMTVLLPGRDGFRRGTGVVVNPSYWVFPALRAFAAVPGGAVWKRVADSGLVLLAKARFGTLQLPPDWALLDAGGAVAPAEGFRKQYGYDAVRVPLYLAWDGYDDPYYFRPFAALAARGGGDGPVPATVSLPGGVTAQVPASVGMLAVYRLACRLAAAGNTVTVPPPGPDEDYYSTTLFHLAALAGQSLGIEP